MNENWWYWPGAARLEIDDVARRTFSRGGNPDVAEVYLAYQTGPPSAWICRGTAEHAVSITAGVDRMKIDLAFETVTAMEAGDGLVNRTTVLDHLRRPTDQYYANKIRFEESFGTGRFAHRAGAGQLNGSLSGSRVTRQTQGSGAKGWRAQWNNKC